ncbi:MAG: hypothetical protein R6V57_14015 [Vicinamibacterales bacterium]
MRVRGSSRALAGRMVPALAAAVVVAAAAVMAAPQKSQPAAPAEPHTVTVLFRALLADGRPFADVRPEDVELKVDGRPRTLGSLQFVQPGSGEAAVAQSEMPPPFATNMTGPALRDTIFVVEDDSIAASMAQAIKDAIQQYIDALAPQDRIGLVTIPRGGLNVGLTTDRAKIQSAVAELSGRAAQSETDADAACRTRQVLDALMNVFRGAAAGSPATIVVFGGGLTPPMIYEMSRMTNTPNLCEIRAKDYEEVERVMLGAPLSVNVIQVPNPTGSGASASTSQTQGLEHLAGVTGNRVMRLVGDSSAAMARLAASNSAYYRATFAAEDSERNGIVRPLSVRVNRPDVDVSSRPRVVIPAARGAKSRAKAASPRDMLRVGDVYRDLPLRAAAFVSREGSSDKARVVVMVEPMEATASLEAAAVGLYDEKGKLIVQATADSESLARTPPMLAAVAKTGMYRMRVAATDAAGRAGTVDSALEVKLTGDGPLKLSSLVLGVAEDGRFAGRLQFFDEPTAVAYLEIYGVPKGVLSAELQLAGIEGGAPAVRGVMRITGEPSDDQHIALGGIPIASFPPGDIAVRAIVSLDGVPIGAVTRTLRKAER